MPCKPSEPEAADQNTRLQFSFSDPGQHTSYTFEVRNMPDFALTDLLYPRFVTIGLNGDPTGSQLTLVRSAQFFPWRSTEDAIKCLKVKPCL